MQGIPSLEYQRALRTQRIYDQFIGLYNPTEQAMLSLICEKLSFVRNLERNRYLHDQPNTEGYMLITHKGKKPDIHPSAYVAPSATICGDVTVGPNCRIIHGASVIAEVIAILNTLSETASCQE